MLNPHSPTFIQDLHDHLSKLKNDINIAGMARYALDPIGAYGVKSQVKKDLAKEIVKQIKTKETLLDTQKALWDEGSCLKMIAIRTLIRMHKLLDDKTYLELIESQIPKITDWGQCDTLATQGFKPWVLNHQKEIFELAHKWVKNENSWIRRFGIVCMVNLVLRGNKKEIDVDAIFNLLDQTMPDQEKYVQKAKYWVLQQITWRATLKTYEFLKRWKGKAPRTVTTQGSQKLPEELKAEIKSK